MMRGEKKMTLRTKRGIDKAIAKSSKQQMRSANTGIYLEAAKKRAAFLDKLIVECEQEYWHLRNWLDSHEGWIRGDDGPAYPLLHLAQKLKALK